MSLHTRQNCEVVEALFHSFLLWVKRILVMNTQDVFLPGKKLPLWIQRSMAFIEFNIRFSNSLQNIKYYFIHFRSVNDQCCIQAYTLCCCTCNHIRVILLNLPTNKLFSFRISSFAVMYGIGDDAAFFSKNCSTVLYIIQVLYYVTI